MTQSILVTAKGELRSFKEGTKLPEKPQLKRFEEVPDDNEREEAHWEFNMEKEQWLSDLETLSTPIHEDNVDMVWNLLFYEREKSSGPRPTLKTDFIPNLYHIEAEFEVVEQFKSGNEWLDINILSGLKRESDSPYEYREAMRLVEANGTGIKQEIPTK